MTATWERVLPSASARRVGRRGSIPLAPRFAVARLAVPGAARRHRSTARSSAAGSRSSRSASRSSTGRTASSTSPPVDLGQLPGDRSRCCSSSASGWNYFLALAIGLVAAVVLGVLVETLIIRRFFHSPRLILTVATIGVAQVLTGAALFLPELVRRPRPSPARARAAVHGQLRAPRRHLQRARRHHDHPRPDRASSRSALFMRRSTSASAIRASRRARRPGARRSASRSSACTRSCGSIATRPRLRRDVPAGRRRRPADRPGARPELPAPGARRGGHRPHGALPDDRGRGDRPRHRRPGDDVPARQPRRVQRRGPLRHRARRAAASRSARRRPRRRRVDVSTWQAAREVRPIPRELARLPEVRYARWGLGARGRPRFLVRCPLWLVASPRSTSPR